MARKLAATARLSLPISGVRLVLLFMGLGLAAMLLSAVVYRFSGNPLVRTLAVPASSASSEVDAPPGMALSVPEEMQSAMIAAMQRLQGDANDLEALLMLADIFLYQGNLQSAQGFINRALTAAPADPRPSYFQGMLEAERGHTDHAIEYMERSLSLGDSAATRYSLGKLYVQIRDKAKARVHFEAGLLFPDLTGELKSLIEAELAKL